MKCWWFDFNFDILNNKSNEEELEKGRWEKIWYKMEKNALNVAKWTTHTIIIQENYIFFDKKISFSLFRALQWSMEINVFRHLVNLWIRRCCVCDMEMFFKLHIFALSLIHEKNSFMFLLDS